MMTPKEIIARLRQMMQSEGWDEGLDTRRFGC